jgi:protein CpxP
MRIKMMRKQILSLAVALLIGSTVCMAQNRQNGKADREKRMEQIVADLGLNEKQAKDFKAAMKEMRPAKNKSNERPTREEMQKKRQEIDAKIKSILTDEQYKKYQDMRKKDNAKKKKTPVVSDNDDDGDEINKTVRQIMLTEGEEKEKSKISTIRLI